MSIDKYISCFRLELSKVIQLKKIVHVLKGKTCLCALCLLTCVSVALASTPNHYIVAFDQRPQGYETFYNSPQILNIIEQALSEKGFDGNKDYLSLVTYGVKEDAPSKEKIVMPCSIGNSPFIWKKIGDRSLRSLFPDWPKSGRPLAQGTYCSMQSLAKQYAVIETQKKSDAADLADNTILFMVTDDWVNGGEDNYAHEWNRTFSEGFLHERDDIFKTLQDFNEEFRFNRTAMYKDGKEVDQFPIYKNYKIVGYDVVPSDHPSIYSETNFPSQLPIKRVRGGYKLDFDVTSNSPKYVIRNISIFNSSEMLCDTKDGKVDFTIPSSKISNGDSLKILMDLELRDGLYDGFILLGENPRNASGLSSQQVVKLSNDAKVFGVIPMIDAFWWFYPNDIKMAAFLWQIIIILAIIGTIIYLLFRWNRKTLIYHVEPDELKLRCVTSSKNSIHKNKLVKKKK